MQKQFNKFSLDDLGKDSKKSIKTAKPKSKAIYILMLMLLCVLVLGTMVGLTWSAFSSQASVSGTITFSINGHSGTINLTNAKVTSYDTSGTTTSIFTIAPDSHYNVVKSLTIHYDNNDYVLNAGDTGDEVSQLDGAFKYSYVPATKIGTLTISNVAVRSSLTITGSSSSAETYIVTFNANGGTGSDKTQTISYGQTTALRLNSDTTGGVVEFVLSGYTFLGWSTESGEDNALVYGDGASVLNLGAITLYAVWQEEGASAELAGSQYVVTLDKQGATTAGLGSVIATYGQAMPSIENQLPTKTYYDFRGYYAEAGGGGTKYYDENGASAHTWDVAEEVTLYAYWEIQDSALRNPNTSSYYGNYVRVSSDGTVNTTEYSTMKGAVDNSSTGDTIYMTIASDNITSSDSVTVSDKTITIKKAPALESATLNQSGALSTGIFYIQSGGTLNHYDIILNGDNTNNGMGVYMSAGSYNLYSGTIQKFINATNGGAGGVYCGGTFTMNGGSITNCSGDFAGGVVCYSSGTFTMNGGSITNCSGALAGGVICYGGSTFTMNGGSITSCSATDSNSAGGVLISDSSSTFTMDSGSITNCTSTGSGSAGGVSMYSGTFTMNGGNMTDCGGVLAGGVVCYEDGTFTMGGGTIKSCTGTLAGGVYVFSGTFTMDSGSITNCSGDYAGGVRCDYGGTFTMNGGSITSCSATDSDSAGGVICYDDSSTFTMNGGSIANCTSTGYVSAGGVYVLSGTFTMDGGAVYGNIYNSSYTNQYSNFRGNVTFNEESSERGLVDTIGGAVVKTSGGDAKFMNIYINDVLALNDDETIDTNVSNGSFPNLSFPSFPIENYRWANSSWGVVENQATYISNNTALYIYIVRPSATITFNSNGGSAVDNITTKNLFDNYGALPEPTKSGYAFCGWNTASDFSGEYVAESTAIKSTSVTLYAKWIDLSGYSQAYIIVSNGEVTGTGSNMNTTLINSCPDGGTIYMNTKSENISSSIIISGKSITIRKSANVASATLNQSGALSNGMFSIQSGGTLNHYDIILNGDNTNNGMGVNMSAGSYNLYSGTIRNFKHTVFSSGVYINNSSNTFTMNGGTITDCTGYNAGGVYGNGASVVFTMNGGSITSCSGTSTGSAGGVYCKGTFTMNGGSITSCSATSGYVGGVYCKGTFTMNGGSITGCSGAKAGGVYSASSGTFTMNGGNITSCSATGSDSAGGGVFVGGSSTFTMNSGNILNCSTTGSTSAGGVYCKDTFKMNGGSITICSATGSNSAGGVFVSGASFTMNGGNLSGCSATNSSSAGGVYVVTGTFIMNGGSIMGCSDTASSSAGGVYMASNAIVTMNGGIIVNCTGTYAGGVYRNSGSFTMNGGGITSCSATGSTSAGGVYGQFTMNAGAVYGNICSSSYTNQYSNFRGTVKVNNNSVKPAVSGTVGGMVIKNSAGTKVFIQITSNNTTYLKNVVMDFTNLGNRDLPTLSGGYPYRWTTSTSSTTKITQLPNDSTAQVCLYY